MTIYNDACIEFNGIIPAEVLEEFGEPEDFSFTTNSDGSASVLKIEEAYGDLCDELNEVVEILKPYGIKPIFGEYNRYFGDYDGYDVFTGECFESMDDVEYGGWLNEHDDHWFGVVRWCNDDIAGKLKEMGIEPTKNNIASVRCACENNHHFTDTMIEAGWDMIEAIINETLG